MCAPGFLLLCAFSSLNSTLSASVLLRRDHSDLSGPLCLSPSPVIYPQGHTPHTPDSPRCQDLASPARATLPLQLPVEIAPHPYRPSLVGREAQNHLGPAGPTAGLGIGDTVGSTHRMLPSTGSAGALAGLPGSELATPFSRGQEDGRRASWD